MTTYSDNIMAAVLAESKRLVGGHIEMGTLSVKSTHAKARRLAKLARYSARSR